MKIFKKYLRVFVFILFFSDISYYSYVQSNVAVVSLVRFFSSYAATYIAAIASQLSFSNQNCTQTIQNALNANFNINKAAPKICTKERSISQVEPVCCGAALISSADNSHDSKIVIHPSVKHTNHASTKTQTKEIHQDHIKKTVSTEAVHKATKRLAKAELKQLAESFAQTERVIRSDARKAWLLELADGAKPQYEISYTDNKISFQPKDGKAYSSVAFNQGRAVPASVEQATNRNIEEAIMRQCIPGYAEYVNGRWNNDFCLLLAIDSDNAIERVRASLNLRHLEAKNMFYEGGLYRAKHDLLKHLYDRDGKLRDYIASRRTKEVSRYIERFVKDTGLTKQQHKKALGYISDGSGLSGSGRGIAPHNLHCLAVNHPMNKVYSDLLVAGDAGDMRAVKEIKEQYPCDLLVQTIASQYQVKFHQALYNEQGVIRVGLADPLYKNLTVKNLSALKQDSAIRETFNQELLVRHSLKKALQERWHIADSEPVYVHDALYKLLDNNGIALSNIIELQDAVEKVITQASTQEEALGLARVFYEPTGVLKEVARQIPELTRLYASGKLFTKEWATQRQQLNKLLQLASAEPVLAPVVQQAVEKLACALKAIHSEEQNECLTEFERAYSKVMEKVGIIAQNAQEPQQDSQQQQQEIPDAKSSMPMPPGPEKKVETQKVVEKIRKTLNSVDSFLDDMESFDGHTLERHVGKTNEELIKRAIKEDIDAATSFTDKSTAIHAVKENIRKNINEISDWIVNEETHRKMFDAVHVNPIGKGAFGGKKQIVYNLTKSRIVLVRDLSSELGFKVLTAFPIVN